MVLLDGRSIGTAFLDGTIMVLDLEKSMTRAFLFSLQKSFFFLCCGFLQQLCKFCSESRNSLDTLFEEQPVC